MPHPSAKQSADRGDIPNPELNPMTNPTLGRNLGRWAEVYFTTPAEQREQAVSELLRELQQDEREHPDLVMESEDDSLPLPEPETASHIAALEAAVRHLEEPPLSVPKDEISTDICPVCQHLNPPDQWYCGMCGYRLKGPANGHSTQGRPLDANPVPRPSALPRQFEQRTVLPSFDVEPIRHFETQTVRDVDHSPLWPLHVEEESRSRSKVIALVVLVALAGGAFLYQRRSAQPAAPRSSLSSQPISSAPAPVSEPSPADAPPQRTADVQRPMDRESTKIAQKDAPADVPEAVPKSAATSAGLDSRSPELTQAPVSKPGLLPDSGNEELSRARLLLASATPDSAQASVWLWKAVGKNNVPAVLLLADLYERGEGVTRNCDQARILLTAALKRGSTEAGQKLRELQNSGCSGR